MRVMPIIYFKAELAEDEPGGLGSKLRHDLHGCGRFGDDDESRLGGRFRLKPVREKAKRAAQGHRAPGQVEAAINLPVIGFKGAVDGRIGIFQESDKPVGLRAGR